MNNLLALLLVSAVARADLTSQLEEEERTLGDSQEKSIQYKSAGEMRQNNFEPISVGFARLFSMNIHNGDP